MHKVKEFANLTGMEVYQILQSREQVFYMEQSVTCEDIDGIDLASTHMWYELEGRAVAYLRLIPPGVIGSEASMGRMLVLPEYRGRGLGKYLLDKAILHMIERWGVREIKISAQAYLLEFYEKIGFRVVSEEYLDGGIPHYKMLLKM